MAIQTKTVLKSYFETAKQPTEQNFVDVFDSVLTTSGDQSITGSLTISGSGANLNVLGHITSSGNISASGTIFANNFQSTGGDVAGIDFTDNVSITGHITASGNISASGNVETQKIGVPSFHFIDFGPAAGSGGFIKLSSDDTEIMRLDGDSGKVGIGTTSPGEKLEVVGNISASGTLKGGGLNIKGTTTFNDGNITNVGNINVDTIQDEGENGTFIKMNPSNITFDVDEQVSVFSIGLSGNVTASGNISASGTISGSKIDGEITSNLVTLGGNRLRTVNDNLDLMDGGLEVNGNITSSGNISASGILYGTDLYLDNVVAIQRAGGILNIGGVTEQTQIDARHEGLEIVGPIGISGVGHITSSGNISASGDIISQRLFPTIISASGKVSAFGSSSLHGLPTSQPTITGSLWISGSGYGAGAQSGYLMIFQG